MTIFFTVAVIVAVISVILILLVKSQEENKEDKMGASGVTAISLIAFVISLVFVIPAAVVLGAIWVISSQFPEWIYINKWSDAISLSFLVIGIVFIVEIFFSGIIKSFVSHFNIPVFITVSCKALIYTFLLHMMPVYVFPNVHVSLTGALVLAILIALLDRLVEEYYLKKKKSSPEEVDASR